LKDVRPMDRVMVDHCRDRISIGTLHLEGQPLVFDRIYS
jgi:hypothetical protein